MSDEGGLAVELFRADSTEGLGTSDSRPRLALIHPHGGASPDGAGASQPEDASWTDVTDSSPGITGGDGPPSEGRLAPPVTRVRRRRARTISVRRLSRAELQRGRALYPETDYWKPRTRAECVDMERPCPFVSCKYHLYVDIHPVRGSIKINFPDLEVWEMTDTCALDIADRGGVTLEEVGEIMNLTRERVRQVETTGLARLSAVDDIARLRDYVG